MSAASPGTMRTAIAQLCAHYGWTLRGDPRPVQHSIQHDNYRIATDAGTRFVRISPPHRTDAQIRLEHRVMRFVASEGIPVPTPIPDASGETLHLIGPHRMAILPWLEGHTVERRTLSVHQAAVFGDMQGRMQAALSRFTDPAIAPAASLTWDTGQSIATLSRIDAQLSPHPAPLAIDRQARHQVRAQLALLQSAGPRPPGDFAALELLPGHGDFHARNVMLNADDTVQAVLDWERTALMPPIFDLYCSLSFVLWDEPAHVDAWVAAYAQHWPLTRAQCEQGIELWWQFRLHNTWALRTVYLEGNPDPREFFEDDARRIARLRDPDWRRALADRVATAAGR